MGFLLATRVPTGAAHAVVSARGHTHTRPASGRVFSHHWRLLVGTRRGGLGRGVPGRGVPLEPEGGAASHLERGQRRNLAKIELNGGHEATGRGSSSDLPGHMTNDIIGGWAPPVPAERKFNAWYFLSSIRPFRLNRNSSQYSMVQFVST